MMLKKIEEKNMPMLNRKRISFEVEFSGTTPKKEDLMKSISSMIKTPEELIALRHVYQKYGINKAKIITNVYEKKEDLKQFEPRKKIPGEKKAEVKQDGKEESKK
nr:hypothetical protein [Candidatus Woesearchaeota archaeon]